MKRHIYTGLLLLGMFSVSAQNKHTAKADKLFDDLKYVAAIGEYLEVVEDGNGDDYVTTRLADTYYNVFNTRKAEEYLAKVVANTEDAEYYFKYAQMLKANGKYDEANTWMDKFSEKMPNDVRAIEHKKAPGVVANLLADTPKFKVSPVEGFNTEFSEFGPVLFIFAGLILTVHLLFLLLFGKLFQLELNELLVASNANLGGPTTAAAMAKAKNWYKLVSPAILCGTLGYTIATFVGVALANFLR